MIVGVAVATVMSVAGTEMLVVVGNTAVVWLQYRCQKIHYMLSVRYLDCLSFRQS